MNIFALADLHLCLSTPDKNMEDFGPRWESYMQRIEENWKKIVKPEDLVLIAGDISWALKLDKALIDLNWIDKLPGRKVMIKGNHDYWWKSINQVRKILPPSIYALQNDALNLEGVSIGGSRLWDSDEYEFSKIIEYKENPKKNPKTPILTPLDNQNIFEKELKRLELSLSLMNPKAPLKIVMTHYPPISHDLKESKVHLLLKKYNINFCIFGHVHNAIETEPKLFGQKDFVHYVFSAADYLQFKPIKII